MTRDEPISNAELAHLFAGLEEYRLLLLAVSGGPDSTALLHLISRWRMRRQAEGLPVPRIEIATVDHRLRRQSQAEARAVARAARQLGLPHCTLVWSEDKPASGLQERAREARYALLAAHLKSFGEPNAALLTAHTADDQAETLIMRLARGSGLDGLAAMPVGRPLEPGSAYGLLRPLLGTRKARLIATLTSASIAWADDPSNAEPAFERVRIRDAAGSLAALGLTPDKLALSARRLSRAREALKQATAELEARALNVHAGAFASIDRAAYMAAAEELRLRLLLRVLAAFGGASPSPRLNKVEALLVRLAGTGSLTATLGGCVVRARSGDLRIFREPGRAGLPQFHLAVGAAAVWDSRFSVKIEHVATAAKPPLGPIAVGALGIAAYATLRSEINDPLPAQAAAALPAFWLGTKLLAVPVLQSGSGRHASCASLPKVPGLSFRTEFVGLPDDARNFS